MPTPAISVRGLGKEYRLGGLPQHDTLRDQLAAAGRAMGRWFRPGEPDSAEESAKTFWALRDVSFDVQEGEAIGIIGRNGAGKSTLLKILSQITEPTEGEIRIRGRLGSLLEVGTGFHPELSGRENIFLNGAVLGMSRAEIRSKLDEIIDFAEVEKFLETPVKRYSSGMIVRLAFAVAAHLEPEILVIDEVLAVGDAAFQNKCLGKMEEVARKRGRTVLFVSHNMSAVEILCQRIIRLDGGRVVGMGEPAEQIRRYLETVKSSRTVTRENAVRIGDKLELRRLEFKPNPVVSGGSVSFLLQLLSIERIRITDLQLLVYSTHGFRAGIIDLRQKDASPYLIEAGQALTIEGQLVSVPLVEGDYPVGLFIFASQFYRDYFDLATLTVSGRGYWGSNIPPKAVFRGVMNFEHDFAWRTGAP